MDEVTLSRPAVKFKKFAYHTGTEWVSKRTGILRSEGKAAFRVASPPEFHGEAGVWTPEDLFVGSIEVCLMMTFAAYAERKELPVLSYTSSAEGILEAVDGKYQFTKVILRPHILLSKADDIELTKRTLQDAYANCLISNSVRSEILVEPKIEAPSVY